MLLSNWLHICGCSRGSANVFSRDSATGTAGQTHCVRLDDYDQAMAALLLALLLHGALHGAQAGDVVLVGLSNRRGGERALRSRPQSAADRPCNCRQCNAAGRLNLDGELRNRQVQSACSISWRAT